MRGEVGDRHGIGAAEGKWKGNYKVSVCRGEECTSNYDLYSIMQFADRINDRLFYWLYEHQQRPYLACRSRNTEPHKTGVPHRVIFGHE